MDCEHLALQQRELKGVNVSSSSESNLVSTSWTNSGNGRKSLSSEAISDHELYSGSEKETVCKALISYKDVEAAYKKGVENVESMETQIMRQKELDCLDENTSCISSSQEGTHNSSCDGDCSEETVYDHSVKNTSRMSVIKSSATEISSRNLCSDAALAKEKLQCLKQHTGKPLEKASTAEISPICVVNREEHARNTDRGSNKREELVLQSSSTNCNDGPNPIEIEVNICDICGDLGYEKSLAVCSKCGDGAEHIYCMRVKLEEVPKCNWLCEECATAEAAEKQEKDDAERKAASMDSVGKVLQRTGALSCEQNPEGNKRGRLGAKTSCRKDKVNSVRGAKSPVPSSEARSAKKGEFFRDRKERQKVSTSADVNLVSSTPLPHPISSEKQLQHTSTCIPITRHSRPYDNADLPQQTLQSRGLHSANFIPQPDCIWRGGFEVKGSGNASTFWDGIQAHLSSSSLNFIEVACKFPRNLALEELPRSSVWSSLFPQPTASINDVALYFFAEDLESYKGSYNTLVERMIENGSCLKGYLGGYELFIFSSKTLLNEFQCWNGLFYLWSVFRDKKAASLESSRLDFFPELLYVDLSQGHDDRDSKRNDGGRETKMKNPGEAESDYAPNLELSLGLAGTCNGEAARNKRRKPSVSSETRDGLSLSLAVSPSVQLPETKASEYNSRMMDGRPKDWT